MDNPLNKLLNQESREHLLSAFYFLFEELDFIFQTKIFLLEQVDLNPRSKNYTKVQRKIEKQIGFFKKLRQVSKYIVGLFQLFVVRLLLNLITYTKLIIMLWNVCQKLTNHSLSWGWKSLKHIDHCQNHTQNWNELHFQKPKNKDDENFSHFSYWYCCNYCYFNYFSNCTTNFHQSSKSYTKFSKFWETLTKCSLYLQ